MVLIRSPEDAERSALEWMLDNGYPDSSLTSAGADGGVDVRAGLAVAQVKAEMKPTGRPAIQQLAGIGTLEESLCLFFSLAGFTDEATEWANKANVALFQFDLQGDPEPLNEAASNVIADAARLGERTVSKDWMGIADSFQVFWADDPPAHIDGTGTSSFGPVEVELNAFDEHPGRSVEVLLQFFVPRSLWSQRVGEVTFLKGLRIHDDADSPWIVIARPRLRSAAEVGAFFEWVATELFIDPLTVALSAVTHVESLIGDVSRWRYDGKVHQSGELARFESSEEIQREFQKAADLGWSSRLAARRKYSNTPDGEVGIVAFRVARKKLDELADKKHVTMIWFVYKNPGPALPPSGFEDESAYESETFHKIRHGFQVSEMSSLIDETLDALGLELSDFLIAYGYQE